LENPVVPARKKPLHSSNDVHLSTQSQPPRDAREITAQRDRLMARVARLRETGSPKAIENVQQLLTRWWSPANWHAREELLKTADWFLRLEEKHQA
jgi:hypothetical protein